MGLVLLQKRSKVAPLALPQQEDTARKQGPEHAVVLVLGLQPPASSLQPAEL